MQRFAVTLAACVALLGVTPGCRDKDGTLAGRSRSAPQTAVRAWRMQPRVSLTGEHRATADSAPLGVDTWKVTWSLHVANGGEPAWIWDLAHATRSYPVASRPPKDSVAAFEDSSLERCLAADGERVAMRVRGIDGGTPKIVYGRGFTVVYALARTLVVTDGIDAPNCEAALERARTTSALVTAGLTRTLLPADTVRNAVREGERVVDGHDVEWLSVWPFVVATREGVAPADAVTYALSSTDVLRMAARIPEERRALERLLGSATPNPLVERLERHLTPGEPFDGDVSSVVGTSPDKAVVETARWMFAHVAPGARAELADRLLARWTGAAKVQHRDGWRYAALAAALSDLGQPARCARLLAAAPKVVEPASYSTEAFQSAADRWLRPCGKPGP